MSLRKDQAIVVDAVRACGVARAEGRRDLMPCLTAALARHECGLAVPAMCGLIEACEGCLGRKLCCGRAGEFSEDETCLLALLDREDNGSLWAEFSSRLGDVLKSAVTSARLLLKEECGGGTVFSLSRMGGK